MADETAESNVSAQFVAQIVTDPAQVPDVIFLTGFLGASSEVGHMRLYTDPAFTEYFEIPEDAILHKVQQPLSSDPLETARVWIKREARLVHKRTNAPDVRSDFFCGPIQEAYSGENAEQGQVGPTAIQNCTQAPQACGQTAWEACPNRQ